MAHAARSPPCKKEALTGEEFLPYATLASSITPPHVSRRRICFAAIPGCWTGRALPTAGCPQPGRPRSGCALGPGVRSAAVTCSSAPVQSISQRGRQRLTAAATQQPPHATGIRLPAAPPAADAQQRPPEAVPEPRQPLLRPPNSPAPQRAPAGSWRPTRCHMPPRTPPHLKTASPDGRRRPSRYNCTCNRPPKARRAPWPCPPP